MALAEHGFHNFYGKSYFADYPPGYCYLLVVVGWLWERFFRASDPQLTILTALLKLPAILADLACGITIYAIVRRFAEVRWALLSAAIYVLNPATIDNSAVYGQVDSLSAGLALLGVYFLLRSSTNRSSSSLLIVLAWLSLAYSLLIKPQAAVLLSFFIAFAFAKSSRRPERMVATGVGIAVSLMLAVIISEPFHQSAPFGAIVWLLSRYEFGSSVYAYNSVNAFNLWAVRGTLWQPDSSRILFIPESLWGIAMVVSTVALCVWRYLRRPSQQAFLEGCSIITLGFFVLATRMHERYIFDGLLFTIACIPFALRYLTASVIFSVILFANLQYALQYLYVMTNQVPNVDSGNLWGLSTQILSLLATCTFVILGYGYLAERRPREQNAAEACAMSH